MKIVMVKKAGGTVVDFGYEELLEALRQGGHAIVNAHHWTGKEADLAVVIGLADTPYVRKHLELDPKAVIGPEAVVIQSREVLGRTVVTCCGGGEVGLQYALLELSEWIAAHGADNLDGLEDRLEQPDNRVRGVSRFVMSHRDDGWFYSEEFWQYYCRRLARCRFNRFVLLLGFDTAYLSPPYPFFVEVPGYEGVKATDDAATAAGRARNLAMLRKIGSICHHYGLLFEFATWQQTPWTASQIPMVEGLAADENALGDYCAAGLRELVNACPEIDIVQLRVNFEAGVGTQTTNDQFWKKLILALSQADRDVALTLRAKGLTPELAAYAQELGLRLSVATKYWCEHIALPHQMTVMRREELERIDNYNHSRRYSYADLLTRPFYYEMIYRLWNYGSCTLFLWGDPDYVRRFSRSIADGRGDGYEITAPLTLKGGMASVPGEDWPVFRNPSLRSGSWEDERYWAWYLYFGRLGYGGDCDAASFDALYAKHYGPGWEHMRQALHTASKIMPLITTFHMPQHPSLHYWPEICTGAALFGEHNHVSDYRGVSYGQSLPSDEQLFYSVDQYVADCKKGEVGDRYNPYQVRDWLLAFSGETGAALDAYQAGNPSPDPEGKAAVLDLSMLKNLALYHAWKLTAAAELAQFRQGVREAVGRSLYALERAMEYWGELVRLGESYHDNMDFKAGDSRGGGKTGSWKDRLPELEADRAKLRELAGEPVPFRLEPHITNNSFRAQVPETHPAGEDLTLTVIPSATVGLKGCPTLYYRNMNHLEGLFHALPMAEEGAGFTATIPGKYLDGRWDLMAYFGGQDGNGNTLLYPGVYSPDCAGPYFVVRIGERL